MLKQPIPIRIEKYNNAVQDSYGNNNNVKFQNF